jgi:uncharacterized membrane protein
MQANVLPILGALLVLLAVAGIARYFAASAKQRNTLSVILVVLGLVAAFFFFFGAGSWLRGHRAQPRPHAGVPANHLMAQETSFICAEESSDNTRSLRHAGSICRPRSS